MLVEIDGEVGGGLDDEATVLGHDAAGEVLGGDVEAEGEVELAGVDGLLAIFLWEFDGRGDVGLGGGGGVAADGLGGLAHLDVGELGVSGADEGGESENRLSNGANRSTHVPHLWVLAVASAARGALAASRAGGWIDVDEKRRDEGELIQVH
ncbi:MAG TPA: hypothetical protein VF777_02425 [Phycisphaerales bacterium]